MTPEHIQALTDMAVRLGPWFAGAVVGGVLLNTFLKRPPWPLGVCRSCGKHRSWRGAPPSTD